MNNNDFNDAISFLKNLKYKLEHLPSEIESTKLDSIDKVSMITISSNFINILEGENSKIVALEKSKTNIEAHDTPNFFIKTISKPIDELKHIATFIADNLKFFEDLSGQDLANHLSELFYSVTFVFQYWVRSNPKLINNSHYSMATHSLLHSYHGASVKALTEQDKSLMKIKALELKNTELTNNISKIESKHSQIEEMLLQATEHHFSKKFQERGADLDEPIKTWTRLLAVSWVTIVCCIFLVLFQNHSPQDLLITSLKVLPLFALAVFCTSQYIKERNFKEEYEFKSILSLTMNPMREQISDPQIQDQITSKLVDMLYRSPLDSTNKVKTGNSDMEFAEKITNRLIDLLPTKSKD